MPRYKLCDRSPRFLPVVLAEQIQRGTFEFTLDYLVTADAGCHSEANLQGLKDRHIAAMIADNDMRQRDSRYAGQGKHKAKPEALHDKRRSEHNRSLFTPKAFRYDRGTNTWVCPAGKSLYSGGSNCTVKGRRHHQFKGTKTNCVPCPLRAQCLRTPERTPIRQVAIFYKHQRSPMKATALMKRSIDSPQGRVLYSQRIGTVGPVFGNLRHNKGSSASRCGGEVR